VRGMLAVGARRYRICFATRVYDELLENWRRNARTANVAHLRMTDTLAWRDFALGGLTAFLSAVVGAGVFASLQGSQAPLGLRIAAGALALAAAGLAALGPRLRYGSRVEAHRTASRAYGNLVREIDQALRDSRSQSTADVTAIREGIDKADADAPNVSAAIWIWADSAVRAEEGDPSVDASTIDRGLWPRLKRLSDRLLTR
jgi:hypothetical protein